MKTPFTIDISQAVLDDLKNRLANTRWTYEMENSKWQHGVNEPYLKELCDYWQHSFDWKKQEDYLNNSFSHYRSIVDGVGLHYIHQKGEGQHSIPLLLIHGWPDSFI